MKLTELLAKTDILIELSEEYNHITEVENLSSRYGYGKCLITEYDKEEKEFKLPKIFYDSGYNKVITTVGKYGNIILYIFKRGKDVRKFISDFTYLKLETFIAYNEIKYQKFSGEVAHQMMHNGKIMTLDGALYRIEDGMLYIKNSGEQDEWRKAKKKHLNRTEWVEFR